MATAVGPCSKRDQLLGRQRQHGSTSDSILTAKHPQWHSLLLVALALLAVAFGPEVHGYTLRVRVQPGRGFGGEPFLEQPQVEILEGDGGDIDVFFEGYVTAEMISSPDGYSSMLHTNDSGDDGTASLTDGRGRATFSGLFVNKAGTGFACRFVAFNGAGIGVAWVDSDPFEVAIGDPYAIALSTPVGTMEGGSTFDILPVIAIQDKGGNIVGSYNGGKVTAWLVEAPGSGSLLPSEQVSDAIRHGYAHFDTLRINEAGVGYRLGFIASGLASPLEGGSYVESEAFTVGVGPAYKLELEEDILYRPIVSGSPFPDQPRVRAYDRGGNLLTDSDSGVLVTVVVNPVSATLRPTDRVFQVMTDGVATFSGLSLDRSGRNLRLRLSLYSYHRQTGKWTDTGVHHTTRFFDVGEGRPASLSLEQDVDGAWAGGHGFKKQPYLTVLDAGGGVVSGDSITMITASVTPSLMVKHNLVIDTSLDPSVEVTRVYTTLEDGSYGVGEEIPITVVFSAPVYVDTSDGQDAPYLYLSGTRADGSTNLPAILINGSSSSDRKPSDELTFIYPVVHGDDVSGMVLEVADRSAIQDGATLLDLQDREVNVTLPTIGAVASLSGTSAISIDTNAPVITAISSSLVGGEYGVGQVIPVRVNFSFPVVVMVGTGASLPLLPLLMSNGTGNGSRTTFAEFSGGNETSTLLFEYSVREGDETGDNAFGVIVAIGVNDRIILPKTSFLSFAAAPAILQRSSGPILAANLTLQGVTGGGNMGLGADGGNVTVETTPPEVDAEKGVGVTGAGNGTYFAGDEIYIRVRFTKPVAVSGDVGLFLATGSRGARADYFSGGNGTYDVVFRYNVVEGDSASRLDVDGRRALDTGDGGYFRRHSTDPTQDADIDLAGAIAAGKSLADTSRVILDGARPQPVSVSLAPGTADNTTYGFGDLIRLAVVFDKNVTLQGAPVLVLDCARMREALFYGGNDSTTLLFEYEVQIGDHADNLGYRFYPNALCLESGCPDAPSSLGSTTPAIRQLITKGGGRGIDASLALSNHLGTRAVGVPVAENVTVDTRGARTTHVVGLTTKTLPGSYGAGQVIDITVQFADEVVLLDASSVRGALPTLSLNNGGEATLTGGTETAEWFFSYEYTGTYGTAVSNLDVANFSETLTLAINCTVECRAVNRDGATVDLSMEGLNLSYAGIQLDAVEPAVIDVYSPKETSPWGGVYTVGEEIEVRVVFDRPVSVLGSPRLLLDTGTYAEFQDTSEDETEVSFYYVVEAGDQSPNVTWAGPLALGANGVGEGGSEDWILRRSTNPVTPADVMLPDEAYPLAINGSTIYVNTTGRPQVVNISSPNEAGTYAPGDVVAIWVTFDRYVMVIGQPNLLLNTGKQEPVKATFVGGSGNETLIFEYEVKEGDLTAGLSLSDRQALEFGFNSSSGTRGYESKLRSIVAQASTNPSVAVDRVLPFYPGESGSLSYNSGIALDGSKPHIQEIVFAGTANETYGGGDIVQILLQFSAPVVVTGSPALKLETGVIDREAVWVNASNANITIGGDAVSIVEAVAANPTLVLFEYTVVTGDKSDDLDYWSDEKNWRDARASFVIPDNMTSVKRLSANPTLDADLHLNPPGGMLQGTDRATAFGGRVYFRDLFVRVRGQTYQMNFEAFVPAGTGVGGDYTDTTTPAFSMASSYSTVGSESSSATSAAPRYAVKIKQSTLFEVGFAVEFEVMSDDSDRSDMFGHAISLDGSLLLAGASKKHRDVPEIQLIVSTGSSAETTAEIQMIAVDAVHVKEIQRFSTYADPYETVGGTWSVNYPGLGSSRGIPADATTGQVQAFLEDDFPSLGRMLVVREEYLFCACSDGYIWTVTFEEVEGDVYTFIPDPSELTGAGANVTEVEVMQDSPVVGGTFTLSYIPWAAVDIDGGVNQTAADALTTRSLPFDTNATVMTTALLEDLNLTATNVEVDCCNAQLGGKWKITFGDDRGDYNISALSCNASGLTGSRASCWQVTGRDGEGPIDGEFRVRFRESAWTSWLPHDVEAAEMKTALFGLESVDDCAVSRTKDAGSAGQHVWSVTFFEVRKPTDFGYVTDKMGNMPAMDVDAGRIRGTEATVEVKYAFGGAMDYAQWEGKQMGSYGEGAGAAYVFSRSAAAEGFVWAQDQKLLGSDTDGQDGFGLSVSIDEDNELLVVGAPYAEDNGLSEVQAISCTATSGTFTLGFRGFLSAAIPANASLFELYTAMRGPFGTTTNLHPFPEIDITERFSSQWDASSPDGLCTGNNSAFLSFRTPRHDFWGGNGDLELLSVDASLLDGDVVVEEIVKGTANPDGPFSRGIQKGAAYVYRKSALTGRWYQETKLFLDDGQGTDRYGWQVTAKGNAVTNDYVIVSAPGRDGEKGSVYVYTYSDTDETWSALQSITSELWSLDTDQFGSSISVSDDTLVVGGAGFNSSAGAAYVFTVSRSGVFQADQRILHPDDPRAGDRFGESLSLHGNSLAIGCPKREDRWLHTGTTVADWEGEDVGAVYLYRRGSAEEAFSFFQKLEASNVKPFDRFGVSVSIDNDALIVGSHQEFEEGNLAYQRAVQVVTVQSDPGGSGVGNVYRLGWKEECADDDDDLCEVRWTRDIETDATGIVLKNTLEEDFDLGVGVSELVVARSGRDESSGGYEYTVIFLEEKETVPQMLVDDSKVTGPNAYVKVESLNTVPGKLRGVTHVFARQVSGDVDSSFREQCFLYPWIKQRQDLFGTTVAVSGQFVAVGASNRDTIHGWYAKSLYRFIHGVLHDAYQSPTSADFNRIQEYGEPDRNSYCGMNAASIPLATALNNSSGRGGPDETGGDTSYEDQNLTSLNTGAVEVFHLDFLSFRFDRPNYSVLEGDTLRMNISRFSNVSTTQVFNLKSMDRNANAEFQDYIAAVYDLSVAYPDVPVFKTAADVVGAGTATARSQYYGSSNNRSLWLGGMFDYRGLSDYTPVGEQLQFLAGETSVLYLLNTTDDNVVETPDETLTIAVYVPGMFPSFLGDLIAVVTIEDNGDGEGRYNATASWGTTGAADSFTTFMDSKTYTSKISAEEIEDMHRFGGAIDSAEGAGRMIVGDEHSEIDGLINCGSAYVYRLAYGAWEQEAQLLPSNRARGAHFGQAVQIDKAYGREQYTALVGAPGQAVVYVFGYNATTQTWEEMQTLVAAGVDLPNHGFGGTNRLSLRGDLAAVGAPGAEAVFIYQRNTTAGGLATVNWTAWGDGPVTTLTSSDFDYDVIHLQKIVHRQDYGAAVALDVTSRTLAVGSPLADYDKLGSDERETYDTRPDKADARARGKVYVYYSKPAVQSVTLGTEFGLSAGSFMLSLQHRNTTSNSTQVSWDARAEEFKTALEALSNVEEIEVTKDEWTDSTGFDHYRWTVSFTSEFAHDPPLLVPSWWGNGCETCTEFSSGYPRGGSTYVNVSHEEWMGGWKEQAVLQASDRRSGDRFGSSVALDQETLLVGADHSSALAETTWDFETGDLVGWRQTGNAFALQPTFGDNPYFRASSLRNSGSGLGGARASKTGFRGRYFVGTYEARPGAGANDYTNPSSDYPQGSFRGDGPTGMLTSEAFTIGGLDGTEGPTVSFLIGGGCDDRTEYVELLADGVGVAKATGECGETMHTVSWDVSSVVGRAGQIRIVDNSSASPWGHINVDEIVLSWEYRGGIHPDRSAKITATGDPSSKAHYVAREGSTSRAGAAYIFSRLEGYTSEAIETSGVSSASSAFNDVSSSRSKTDSTCLSSVAAKSYYCPSGRDRTTCRWEESAKLTARDRRGGDLFGGSLAVDHDSGVAVVGAAGASLTGIWREPPTVYTTTNPHGDAETARATRVPLPMDPRNAKLLRFHGAYGSAVQAGSGAPAVWQLQDTKYALDDSEQQFNNRGNAQAGAVYVFTRLPTANGVGLKCDIDKEGDAEAVWQGYERFKLQAHDAVAADRFGSAVSYLASERALFVGAPRSDSFGADAGAAYQFDVGVAKASFMQAEFSVEENDWRQLHEGPQYLDDWKATVTVARDSDQSDYWLTIAFSTSDLTAKGIDTDAYRECSTLPVADRSHDVCGDYEQTTGELTFKPGQTERSFFVRIMNDHCRERYPEYVQLALSVPGGGALQGEQYLSKLRIDDDDRHRQECV